MGRLVGDPELKNTPSGTAVCAIRIAVDRDYTAQNGERQTDFIDVVTWRQTAEFVSRYFQKGKMIVVQGSLHSRKWQDKDGNNRISWEVQADRVWFGGSKNDNSDISREEAADRDSYDPPALPAGDSGDGDFTPMPNEDLPF